MLSLVEDGPLDGRGELGQDVLIAAEALCGVVIVGMDVVKVSLSYEAVVVRRWDGFVKSLGLEDGIMEQPMNSKSI